MNMRSGITDQLLLILRSVDVLPTVLTAHGGGAPIEGILYHLHKLQDSILYS